MRVAYLEVDLGAVERGLPHSPLVLLTHRLQRLAERSFGDLPLLLGTQPFLLRVVAGR